MAYEAWAWAGFEAHIIIICIISTHYYYMNNNIKRVDPNPWPGQALSYPDRPDSESIETDPLKFCGCPNARNMAIAANGQRLKCWNKLWKHYKISLISFCDFFCFFFALFSKFAPSFHEIHWLITLTTPNKSTSTFCPSDTTQTQTNGGSWNPWQRGVSALAWQPWIG